MKQSKHTFTEMARRAQIIECAIDSLAELGYMKTSLAQIAKRAKISTSVVSYYFAGKDDLMREVIDKVYRDAALFMESKIDLNGTADVILRHYIESNLTYGREHARELKAFAEIVTHWLVEPDKLPAEATADDSILKPLEEILQWGQASGIFRTFDTRPMAVTIRKAIDGALEQWVTNPDTDIRAYTEEVITLFDLATRKTVRNNEEPL